MKNTNWRKLGFEFLSIFIAVISAFALNNWNENRRDNEAADKILAEISNGLEKDIEDIRINKKGHEDGVAACNFWRDVLEERAMNLDTMPMHYFNLTRDFISIQNISGYETLKSRGLELIEDDSLRFEIITLYEYDYNILKKFEEEYNEMQYQDNYFEEINNMVAPNFEYDTFGNITGIKLPLNISEAEKNILMSYLWKIQMNRHFILGYYTQTEEKLIQLREKIEKEIK
ncbi:MAG: hypothetical protein DWQ02_23370 [Bacteroidetes bacterium]|nr:MAG: hypothetical protein DWQ02_23370 [Bacteroidota bacterium]